MPQNYENIVFSYLNLPECPCAEIVAELASLPEDNWFFDSYRTTYMLPIYTDKGGVGKVGSLNSGNDKSWTPYAPTLLTEYLTKNIMPWMKPFGRVMILKTPPGAESAPHIDCRLEDFSVMQPKLRIVLQGTVPSLYFITKDGEISPKSNHLGKPFLMDGRWPHGMKNTFNDYKYTVCIGSPWKGEGIASDLLYSESESIKWNDIELPANHDMYFEDLEKRKMKFKEA